MIPPEMRIQSSTTTPPPPPTSDGSTTYTVRRGETLGELSARYGVSEEQILAANPQLRHPNELGAGQEISIPIMDNGGKLPAQVKVPPGDTLTRIGANHGVSVTALASANGIANPNEVRAGQRLWIPVKGSPAAGVASSANPFQPQIAAVDAAVKQVHAAKSGTQRQAASVALTQAVENEMSARAQAEVPAGQLPSDSLFASYGAAIDSRYGNNPAVARATQQAVNNQRAALRVDAALRQVQSAQQAQRVVGPNASQSAKNRLQQNLTTAQNRLLSQVEGEIDTRAALAPGQLPSQAEVQKYEAVIAQRYAGDPAAASAVNAALKEVPADLQAQRIVGSARSVKDPVKALNELNQAYTKATPQVQTRILAQSGTQTILKAAAAQEVHPLSQVDPNNQNYYQSIGALNRSLQNLNQSASHLDPTLAAGLVNQALPQIEHFNSKYAAQNGGQSLTSDPLAAAGPIMATVMGLSGRLAGTAQGQQDIAQLARLGFWNNTAVSNALYEGASAAYPEAVARMMIAHGQDPTNVMSIIQQGVQADQHQVQGDVQALGQHNEALSWLVGNLGHSMTAPELSKAVTQYENQPGWKEKNDQLTQKVVADGTTLTQNMKALSALAQLDPKAASTLNIKGTLSAALNDPATSYGLTLAAGNNPGLYADSQGRSFLGVVSSLQLSDFGRKTAQLIGSMAVRNLVTKALNGVDWTGPDALAQAQAAIESLKSPALSNWMGVNDNSVWNSAVNTVEKHLPSPGDSEEEIAQRLSSMNNALNKLKALSASTPAGQLLRSVAVAYAFANTVSSAKGFASAEGAPDKTIAGLQTLTAAAGLLQKGANLANGFGLVDSGSLWASFAKDTANGTISIASGALDLVEAVRSYGGLGEPQNTANGVFSTLGGVGGIAYGASQFAETGIFDGFADASFGVAGGTFAAALGLAGVGIAAVGVLGAAVYQQYQSDHQYQGVGKSFLEAGGYSPAAASALSTQGGLLSGVGGASGVPFLVKYAQMKHLTTAQLQQWVNSLTPSQVSTLDQCLLQTASDSNGKTADFTNGPPQTTYIYGGYTAVPVTRANTLGVFESNLKSSGVPLPP